jgi:hypothetical protein
MNTTRRELRTNDDGSGTAAVATDSGPMSVPDANVSDDPWKDSKMAVRSPA